MPGYNGNLGYRIREGWNNLSPITRAVLVGGTVISSVWWRLDHNADAHHAAKCDPVAISDLGIHPDASQMDRLKQPKYAATWDKELHDRYPEAHIELGEVALLPDESC